MADNGDRLTVRGFSAGKYIFEDGNGDFVSYTPEEVGRPAPPQPFMDQRLTAMLRDGKSQDDEPTFGSSLQKGIYDTADMTGAGLRFLGAKETGAALSDWAQEKSRALPEPEGAVQEAGRMLPSSMVIPMALQAASYPAAFIPGPIGPAVSLALKGMAWAYPAAMGAVQYQQTKEAAQEKGIDPGAAPYITGGLETAGEIIPMAIFNRILPMGNVISAIVKQSGKDILTMPIGKFAKMAGTGMAADVGGEMVTAYGQGATEQSYGIRPDADPIGEMLGVAAPSALLSAATAGVLGGGKYISTNVYDHVLANKAIEDDNLDKRKDVRRIAAATLTDSLLSGGTQEHVQLASKWKEYSDRQINANLPIDMASPLVDVLNHVSAPIDLTKARIRPETNTMFSAVTGDVMPRRVSASTINVPTEGPMQGPAPYNPAMENAGPAGPEVASDFNMPYNAAAGAGITPSVFAARSAITVPDNNLNRPVAGQGMGPINEPVAVANPMERKVAPVAPVPFASGVHPTLERPVSDQRTWFGPYIDVSGRAQYSGTEQTPQVQPEPVQMQPVTQPVQQPVQTATPTITLKPEPAPKVKVPPKKMGKEPMIKTVEAGSVVKKFEETPEAPIAPAPIKAGGQKRILTSSERDQLGLPTIKEWIQLEDGDWNEFAKMPEKNRNKVIARYNTEMANEAERMGFFSSTATQSSVSTKKPAPVKVSTKPVPVVPKKAPITKQETKEVTTKTKAKEKPAVVEEQKKPEPKVVKAVEKRAPVPQNNIAPVVDDIAIGEEAAPAFADYWYSPGKGGHEAYIKYWKEREPDTVDQLAKDTMKVDSRINKDAAIELAVESVAENHAQTMSEKYKISNAAVKANVNKYLKHEANDVGDTVTPDLLYEKYRAAKERDRKTLTQVANWLLGKDNAPAEPTVNYRGVHILGKAPEESPDYLHVTPWESVASRGGKGGFGDPSSYKVESYPSLPGHLYYRGGSLAGDPLESTRILNLRGMTWSDALSAAKKAFEEEKTKRASEIEKTIRSMQLDEIQAKEAREAHLTRLAEEIADDFRKATFEADAKNAPGYWANRPIPKKLNRTTPELRTYDEIASTEGKNKTLQSLGYSIKDIEGMNRRQKIDIINRKIRKQETSKVTVTKTETKNKPPVKKTSRVIEANYKRHEIRHEMPDDMFVAYEDGMRRTFGRTIEEVKSGIDEIIKSKQKEEKKAPEKKPVVKAETKPVEKKPVEGKQKKIEAMKKAEPVKKKDETEPTTAELTRASNQLEENIKAVKDPKKDIDAVKDKAEQKRQMVKDETAKQKALFEITGDDKAGYHVTYKGKSFIDHVFKTRESAEVSVNGYASTKASEVLTKKLGSKASFMRSTREKAVHGMSAGAARDIVDRFVSRLNNFPKVNVFYSYSELPQAIKDVIAEESPEIDTDSIGGFILENEGKHEIFILSDTIETEHELEKVMAHEIFGHYGIEKILGKEFKPVMLGIYESYKNDPRMKKTLKLAKVSDEALKTDDGKVLAAKEMMAELATNHRLGDASILKRFMDLVRSFLRKFNLKTEWTDNDLLRIVSASKNFVTNGPRLYTVNDSIVDSVVTKDKDGNSQHHDIGSDKQVSFMQVVDTMPDVDKISLSHPMFEWAKAGRDTLAMLRPKNLKQMSTAEEWLASPEYWQHPVLKKLFEIAMKRSDLFHQNFARFIAIRKVRKDANGNEMKDENGNPIMYDTGDNVLDLCKKHMKVDWMNRTVTRLKHGKEAIERADKYRKQVNEIIDEMSTSNGMLQWRDWMDGAGHYHTGYRAEILKKCEYPVVEMVDALRDSYDRVIDERIASLEAIKVEIEADARERNIPPNEVKYPNFPTYDENGDRVYMTLKEAILEMGKWKNSYAPRTRDGKYTFKAVKIGRDGKKDLWRIQHDSRLVLNKERNEMKAKGYDVTEIEEVERLPEVIDANLRYSDIQQVMDKAFERLSKDYRDEPTKMEKLYIHHGDMIMAIRNELMSRGFRTYQMKRREDVVIKGYEMDALKQAVVYHANFASGLAKIETAKKMTEAITPKWENVQVVDEDGTVRTERRMVEGSGIDSSKERKIYATAHKYIQHQLRNADDLDKKIAKIKQVISLKYLGLSLRAPIVNATSLIITAPAAISSVVEGSTFAKIMPAMKNSMKDYTRFMIMADNGKDMTGKFDDGELEFLLEMKKSGVDNPQFTSAAMGGITSTTIGSTWDNIVTSGMSLFRVSEQLIRGTTMLAAYRVAKQQGRTEEDARQLAEEATMRANAVYNRPSDPLWAMGDGYGAKVGQLYYMYMKFPHNYLQLLYHTMIRKKQFRAGAWLLGAPLALSGPMAFPFYSTLTSFVNMIASALFGDDRDMEKVFWDHIEANYDPAVVKVMKGGALGAMDVDLSSSLSVGIEAPSKLTDFFGVFGGALNDVSEAYKQANVGNWWRAVSKIMPGIISSSARAGLEYRSGVSTMRAQPLYDEKGNVVMPGLKQTITRGIAGLESFDIAEMKRKEYRAKRQLKTMKDKRDRILHSYRVYSSGLRHSPEFLKDIMTDVSEYNRKARLYGGNKAGIALITPQTLERQKEKFEHPSAQARKLYYKAP